MVAKSISDSERDFFPTSDKMKQKIIGCETNMINSKELKKKNKDKVEQMKADIYYNSWGM